MNFTKSEKGKDRLKLDNYILYHDRFHEMADGSIKTYWHCSRYKDLSCPFRAHTVAGIVVKKISVHNHALTKPILRKKHWENREKKL